MSCYFIKEESFNQFLTKLIQSKTVVGPTGVTVASPTGKKTKFKFSKLESSDDLRLDYDVTLLPPKKVFYPTCQPIVKFDGSKYQGCVDDRERILFGVHPYDIKALDMTDFLFEQNNCDNNYVASRKAATVIGSNIQNVSARAFFATVGNVEPKGHDGFITKIAGGYTYEAINKKGEDLCEFGDFEKASDSQISESKKANESIGDSCPEKLSHSSDEIAQKVRGHFDKKEFWEESAKDCFSCGSCNIVCPTCYCFDVQDDWNVNQTSGVRTRYWDACLTEDFAKVSLGAGAEENFREERGDRFRHRIMRKTAYLNESLGTPACVGCGRCSSACTADIADPVNVINKIMES